MSRVVPKLGHSGTPVRLGSLANGLRACSLCDYVRLCWPRIFSGPGMAASRWALKFALCHVQKSVAVIQCDGRASSLANR